MEFAQFCDMVENTEQEQQLFQLFKENEEEMSQLENSKLKYIPVIGKVCTALTELSKSESIASFKKSEYYPYIMNWDIKVDYDTGSLALTPGTVHKKIIVKTLAVVVVVTTLLLLCRKSCCRMG
jgi:hypothetical protein